MEPDMMPESLYCSSVYQMYHFCCPLVLHVSVHYLENVRRSEQWDQEITCYISLRKSLKISHVVH